MENIKNSNLFTEFRKVFWPIESHENKKFFLMLSMMLCILFNYLALSSIKDGFIITTIGPQAISFLKIYVVLPATILMIMLYIKLCNILNQQKVFYTISCIFTVFLVCFTFLLYPYQEFLHPSTETVETLVLAYPALKWFIKIWGHWTFAIFYTMAELYGSTLLSLLFWQFANQIIKTNEAKRFYPMFMLMSSLLLPLLTVIMKFLLFSKTTFIETNENRFIPILSVIILSNFFVMFFYSLVNKKLLTDMIIHETGEKEINLGKKEVKLYFIDTIKLIFTSKYLGLLLILVFACSTSINLVQSVWRSKIAELYSTPEAYSGFITSFLVFKGITTIILMIIGANIIRKFTWKTAAIITPFVVLVSGMVFFLLVIFNQSISLSLSVFFGTNALMLMVTVGAAQNVFSIATKNSLFDATKEMAYIPLEDEIKIKGKVAVDMIYGSLGHLIPSTFFMLLPSYSFDEATPYFAGIFFIIVIIWLFAVQNLNKRYEAEIA